MRTATIFLTLLLTACSTSNQEPLSIEANSCFIDFIDDNHTTVNRRALNGDQIYYDFGNRWAESERKIAEEAIKSIENIVPYNLKHGTADSSQTIHFKMQKTLDVGSFAEATPGGNVEYIYHPAKQPPRVRLDVIQHELGHVFGLNHPGKETNGTRPNDWNVDGKWDGNNWVSDRDVISPDGRTMLDATNTIMAYDRDEPNGYRWMDVMALRHIHGAKNEAPNVRHFKEVDNLGKCQ